LVTSIPTLCLNCSTVCGMIAKVADGKILKLEGNPRDPNSRGKLCAKGQAAINMVEDKERLLYPKRRVGPRGSGQWENVSWDMALQEIAERLRHLRTTGRPEALMFQYGRDRTNGFLERFTDAFGTPNKVGHRGLCSLNKRMAIRAVLGDTDWDTADFANSRFILNFGSNFYEAHQGHVAMLSRVAEAKRAGARMVTFDVRLTNTAALSDEWWPIFPGTDGLVALAMGNVILRENLENHTFIDNWTNVTVAELQQHYEKYTPAWAERESGIPAHVIERLAREFAQAAPTCTTVTNRGTHAHENGFLNEWAVTTLNALVGNVGEPGGWCYIPGDVNRSAPQPGPMPPKPSIRTELSHPSAFPLANELYPRAVSSTLYPYLAVGKVKIDTLISYYVNAPMSWPEGPTLVRDVLLDEQIIPFHVAIDAFPSETVEVADYVLPDATFLEKWDLDARNSYDFREYVGLRQPVVAPPGECRDIRDILIQLAHEIDSDMSQYFPFANSEEFVRIWAEKIPGGLRGLQETGIWVDNDSPQKYRTYLDEVDVSLEDFGVSQNEDGVVLKQSSDGKLVEIGLSWHGKVVRGFATPGRRMQLRIRRLEELGLVHPGQTLPDYRPISAHQALQENDIILTTFKWNVHTQSRTLNQMWLTEIVGDNPCWIHPVTAKKYGIEDGAWMQLRRFDSTGKLQVLDVQAHCTDAIHPRVVALSASFGHWQYGENAKGRGFNPNPLIPAWVDPIGGGQAWNDTVVTIAANAKPGFEAVQSTNFEQSL